MQEQKYILKNISSFEPKHIFECGQCFRWDEEKDGSYTGVVKNNVINVQKVDKELENNIDSLQNKTLVANGDLSAYIKTLEEKTEALQKLTTEAIEQATQAGEDLQIRRQYIKETISEFSTQIQVLNAEVDGAAANVKKSSEASVAAMAEVSENMERCSTTLNEATSVVVAQSQVSEASLAQQHKNITASAARVEEIKATAQEIYHIFEQK